jgi:hypothetical protein
MGRRFRGRARQAVLAACLALSVVPLVARPAAAAPPPQPSLEGGAFGTWLNNFNPAPYSFPNFGPQPQVVTPPGGGTATQTDGAHSFMGLPPLVPPLLSVGPSGAATAGAFSNKLPEVDSFSALCLQGSNMNMNNNGFVYPLTANPGFCSNGQKSSGPSLDLELGGLSVQANKLTSACYAQDSTNPTQVAASTYVNSLTINGQSKPAGLIPPNTTYVEPYSGGTLTFVFNEQVPGQSSDHFKGILVNALHIYVSSIPTGGYTNANSALFSESRCEVAIVPIPPGIIPEAPLAAALPISAVALGGGAILVVRFRRRRRRVVA